MRIRHRVTTTGAHDVHFSTLTGTPRRLHGYQNIDFRCGCSETTEGHKFVLTCPATPTVGDAPSGTAGTGDHVGGRSVLARVIGVGIVVVVVLCIATGLALELYTLPESAFDEQLAECLPEQSRHATVDGKIDRIGQYYEEVGDQND